MVALNSSMKQIYDCEPGRDVYFSTSDIGWVVGHSYIVYGPLLQGIPTVLFEGTPVYPNPNAWWKVVEKYGVTVVISSAKAMYFIGSVTIQVRAVGPGVSTFTLPVIWPIGNSKIRSSAWRASLQTWDGPGDPPSCIADPRANT